jgi:hypothetical protein
MLVASRVLTAMTAAATHLQSGDLDALGPEAHPTEQEGRTGHQNDRRYAERDPCQHRPAPLQQGASFLFMWAFIW